MRAAVRAPGDGHVLDILAFQRSEVRLVVRHFSKVHHVGAVGSSMLSIGGANPDVKRGGDVPQSGREDVGWSEGGAGDEASNLGFSRRVALLSSAQNNAFH